MISPRYAINDELLYMPWGARLYDEGIFQLFQISIYFDASIL